MSSWKATPRPIRSNPEKPEQPPSDALDRLQSLFLATLNHEIRTPLAGLMGMTDLLLETNLDDEQREYASTARLCAEDLLRILSAALQYSALSAGQVKLEEAEFNLRELLEAAVGEHAAMAKTKNLQLSASIDPELPPSVTADGLHIKEVLVYLLSNAIKFTHHGSIELRVSPASGALRFSVRDTGIGIPAERRKQIFESFRQLDEGLAREYNGVGLGLTLAEKLTKLMKGRLTVDSEPSVGSTFTIQIPVRGLESISRKLDAWDTLGNAGQNVPAPTAIPLVLAVEDNAIGATVIRHALKRHPVELHVAASGEEAVALSALRAYDVILMDLQMPGMSGLEAAAAIRKLQGYQDVPILALTADMSDEVRQQCFQSGMRGFLTKPIQSAPLWAAIQRELKLTEASSTPTR